MRDVGHQIAAQPIGVLQALGHRVERARQRADRRRAVLGDAHVVVAVRDAIGGVHHGAERDADAPHACRRPATITTHDAAKISSDQNRRERRRRGRRAESLPAASQPSASDAAISDRAAAAAATSANRRKNRTRTTCGRRPAAVRGHGSLSGHHGGRPVAGRTSRIIVRELVADAVHRQHVARIARIRLELAPQVLDVRVDGAVERFDLVAANRVEQLRAREHAPGLPHQRRQQLELGRRQSIGAPPTLACMRGSSSVTSPARMTSPCSGGASTRRNTARTRATSSFGLNGFVT